MRVGFNYNELTIETEYRGVHKSFHYYDYRKSIGAIWPLLVFNLLLKDYKKQYEECLKSGGKITHVPVYDIMDEYFDESVLPSDPADYASRSIRYINDIVLKDIPLRINEHSTLKGYYTLDIGEEISTLEWELSVDDFTEMGKYGLEDVSAIEAWSCLDGLILGEHLNTQGDVLGIALRNKKRANLLKGESVKPGLVWDVDKNNEIIEEIERYFTIDPELLPQVIVAGKTFVNLSEFVLDKYVRYFDNYNSYSILEGDAGAGKSYSLYYTAKNLSRAGHIPIIVPLNEVFSEEGTGSLFSHICKYMRGLSQKTPIERIRNLFRRAEDSQKVFFIVDGFDEVFPGYYSQLGYEMDEIIKIGNPNVFIILAGRNASHFIENSSMQNKDCLSISCEEITLKTSAKEDADLEVILEKYPETRSPLFISYYRETMAKYKMIRSDSARAKNLKLYGNDIEFNKIHNYYDLFKAKTSMLCAHAKVNTGTDELFSSVIPELAYNLYIDGEKVFSKGFLERINQDYFEDAELDEKINTVLSSGVIRKNISDSNYVFSHYEYMQFLAAMHAAKMIKASEVLMDPILGEAMNRTTYHYSSENEEIERVDKMRFIPFGYYLIKELLNTKDSTHIDDNLERGFNPLLFRLAANVVYEEKDLWDEINPFTRYYLDDRKNAFINGKKITIECDDWELLDAISVVSYTMTTKTKKRGEQKIETLNRIVDDLIDCAGIILHDIFDDMKKKEQYYCILKSSNNKWNVDFATNSIKELTRMVRSAAVIDCTKWKYPIDLLGRVYGNIGAALLEKARTYRSMNGPVIEANPDAFLEIAERFHGLAKDYREAISERFADLRPVIGLIRSNIALGTDLFYRGLYETNIDKAIEHLENAVKAYHHTALKLQGLDPALAYDYSCNISLPIDRTLEVQEKTRNGAEAFIVWPRIAGCYQVCYTKLKGRHDENDNTTIREYINKQYIALRAAYLFLLEACVSDYDSREIDKTKSEIHVAAIDQLYEDVSKKYIDSFSDSLCDNKDDILMLLKSISIMYKSLHQYSKVGDVKLKIDGSFVITSQN